MQYRFLHIIMPIADGKSVFERMMEGTEAVNSVAQNKRRITRRINIIGNIEVKLIDRVRE